MADEEPKVAPLKTELIYNYDYEDDVLKNFSTIADQIRDQLIEEFDKTFTHGLTLLSQRKKNRIKKWVIKALRKERLSNEKQK